MLVPPLPLQEKVMSWHERGKNKESTRERHASSTDFTDLWKETTDGWVEVKEIKGKRDKWSRETRYKVKVEINNHRWKMLWGGIKEEWAHVFGRMTHEEWRKNSDGLEGNNNTKLSVQLSVLTKLSSPIRSNCFIIEYKRYTHKKKLRSKKILYFFYLYSNLLHVQYFFWCKIRDH